MLETMRSEVPARRRGRRIKAATFGNHRDRCRAYHSRRRIASSRSSCCGRVLMP